MELQTKARFLAKVVSVLYARRSLRGRLTSATRGARFVSLAVRLGDPLQLDTALALAEPLALATNTPAVIAQRRADMPGLVSYQFQLQAGYWQSYTRADLVSRPGAIGVGFGESRRQIDLTFDVPHVGVFGITGSGKTETVKSMGVGLFSTYSPDELQAVIVDMKGKYTDFANVAHLGMPIAHTDEEIDKALLFINDQIKRREENSIFNARRLVIIIDEAEAIFSTITRLQIGKALVQRGREIRIHGLFATQEPHKGNFGKHLMRQIGGRWIGLVDDANTSRYVTGRASLECHKLTGTGDFIRLRPGAEYDRLQVALATRRDFDQLPRTEIATPELSQTEPLDTGRLPDNARVLNLDQRGPGAPRTEIEPRKVAYYMAHGPNNITIAQAQETMNLARYAHYKHRDFAQEVLGELQRLLAAMKGEPHEQRQTTSDQS